MSLPEPLITISPDYLNGAPVFTGTRVPVQALFDYIEGATLSTSSCRIFQTSPESTQLPCSIWRSGLPSPKP